MQKNVSTTDIWNSDLIKSHNNINESLRFGIYDW